MEFSEEDNRIFLKGKEGQLIGEITYSSAGDHTLIVDHTFVDDSHRGQGIAQKLVKAVVEKARTDNKKIIPLCPFAKAEFARNKEYHDVLRG